MPNTRHKIVIASPDGVYRKQAALYLENHSCCKIIGEVQKDYELLEIDRLKFCNILIFDSAFFSNNCFGFISEIKAVFPMVKIIAIMDTGWENVILKLYSQKINGYLIKENHFNEFSIAIQSVKEGKFYFSPEITVQLLNDKLLNNKNFNGFTGTESKILQLINKGCSNQTIAEELKVRMQAIYSHKHNIHRKTDTKNDIELIKF